MTREDATAELAEAESPSAAEPGGEIGSVNAIIRK